MRIMEPIDHVVIAELCGKHDDFFWLDVTGPTTDEIKQLGAVLGLHPLAIDDSIHFEQRPKLDTYADTALLVLHGGVASHPENENTHPLEEIHCYISGCAPAATASHTGHRAVTLLVSSWTRTEAPAGA